ncbi:MAG: hypothetical protein RLZZ436_4111 [Planctomycetota bacterium]
MSVEHLRPKESLQGAPRWLLSVALLSLTAHCGCALKLTDGVALQSLQSSHPASIARVSLASDEDGSSGVVAGSERDVEDAKDSAAGSAGAARSESTNKSGAVSGVSGGRAGRRASVSDASDASNAVDRVDRVNRPNRTGPASGHSLVPRPAAESAARSETVNRSTGTGRSESLPAGEPGMLDRFRALYAPRGEALSKAESAPRVDDASERLRRQMLRWSDPFGLLKEREGTAEDGGIAELESEGSAERLVEGSEAAGATGALSANALAPVDAVIQSLEAELRDWPGAASGRPERLEEWRRRQTDLRLLYSVSGRSADAARVIDGLPREEQEFWQSLMLAMNQYRSQGAGPERTEQLTEALNQVRSAARHLQPLSRLEIYRLQFCTRIDGFGNAAAFPTADFEPGQRLLLYAGVRNFRSELTTEGRYRSEFAAVVEFLREEDGEVLERIRLPQIPDECDEERTDYFQSFELTAPVLEGNYIVRLYLRDQLTRQTAEARLRMVIR